jgi:hypothetical protein
MKVKQRFKRIHCTNCYIFRQQKKYEVHIDKIIVAGANKKDAFVVCTCEIAIVLDIIKYLTNLVDVNARQTICLTPCNEDGSLLPKKPKSWEEIKDGKFLTING